MGKVVKLDVKRRYNPLEKELEDLMRLLSEMYVHLNEAMEALNVMEHECDKIEALYNSILLRYADEVGHENIKMKYLEFSSQAVAELGPDGQVRLVLKEKKE